MGVDMEEKIEPVAGESNGHVTKSLGEPTAAETPPPPLSHGRVATHKPLLHATGIRAMAGTPMKSSQLQEVVVAGGEILGDVDEQVALLGDVDKKVKVSDVVDGQVHNSDQEGNEVHHSSQDVDKQRQMWDNMDENTQIWDAADKQRKLEKLEEKRKKQEERKQKKKRRMDLEVKKKELKKRRKKSARGSGSPSAAHLSQRVTRSPFVKSPLARSPGANKLGSSLGVLAEAAASKSERSPSAGGKPSVRSPSAGGKPSVRSPSLPGSPSPSARTVRRGRKLRRLTSAVWRDFIPHYDGGKLAEAECKHCNEFLPAGRGFGTSGVRRHLDTCTVRSDMHLIVQKLQSSVTSPHASVLKNWEFDQKKSRRLLARMIIIDELPFSVVEYSGFIDFVKSLNPLFKMVSRNTIKDDIMKSYYQKRSQLREAFEHYPGRVSLTSDMWTSNQTLGYICITAHFIDWNWKLHNKIIRFCMLETPHNGAAMFNILLKSLQEWNIEDKLFSITVDNASVNGTMLDNLRDNLVSKNMLHYGGALLHIRCAAHVLNLIVQDGLLAVKGAIDNIRESVKYIKSSQTRLDSFTAVVSQVGISGELPSVDVSTRWNSTYLMLESAFPFRKSFHTLAKEDKNYKFCPSSIEWRRAETVCSMLRTFHTATQVVSGSTYPTSNLYFHEVWNVKLLLEREASKKDEESRKDGVINLMVDKMQQKFNKYWLESYLANSIPVILDPRFKYEFIKFRLEQAFGSDAAKHLRLVEAALLGLFKEYSSQMSNSMNDSSQENIDEVVMAPNDPLADWDQHLSKTQRKPANELDRYLEEETFPRQDGFNILEWWALHSSKYPVLSQIARKVLAISASVVPSESAFSTGQRVISDYRSRLKSTTIEALICLQSWFKKYESLADVVDDSDI